MESSDEEKLQRIAELKQLIPKVECKGLCFRTCTAIAMSKLEHQAIEERHGVHILKTPVELAIKYDMGPRCTALGEDNRCKIWEDKEVYPAICSAFGAVEHMPCRFNCVPEGGYMSLEEYKLLQADIEDIGGSWVSTPMDRIRLRQLLSTRTGRRRFREKVMGDMARFDAWWDKYIEENPDNLPLGEA